LFFPKKLMAAATAGNLAIAVWSPGAYNTAGISLRLAKEAARHTNTALVELPCMGIPRLALEAGILNRANHTDAAILAYERNGSSPLKFCHNISDTLAVLPANPYALPDHPVVHKVTGSDTLQSFPGFFLDQARTGGYSAVIFECQGGLVSPMTFCALRKSGKVLLVVDGPSDIAWSLLNKKRLTETYNVKEKFFYVTTAGSEKSKYGMEIERVLKCPFIAPDKLAEIFTAARGQAPEQIQGEDSDQGSENTGRSVSKILPSGKQVAAK